MLAVIVPLSKRVQWAEYRLVQSEVWKVCVCMCVGLYMCVCRGGVGVVIWELLAVNMCQRGMPAAFFPAQVEKHSACYTLLNPHSRFGPNCTKPLRYITNRRTVWKKSERPLTACQKRLVICNWTAFWTFHLSSKRLFHFWPSDGKPGSLSVDGVVLIWLWVTWVTH